MLALWGIKLYYTAAKITQHMVLVQNQTNGSTRQEGQPVCVGTHMTCKIVALYNWKEGTIL